MAASHSSVQAVHHHTTVGPAAGAAAALAAPHMTAAMNLIALDVVTPDLSVSVQAVQFMTHQ